MQKEKKKDSYFCGRKTPGSGPVVAQRLLLVMQSQIQIDRDTRNRMMAAGTNCNNVNLAHAACPRYHHKES